MFGKLEGVKISGIMSAVPTKVVDNLNSVITYENGGSSYSRIVMSLLHGNPQYMYIYK